MSTGDARRIELDAANCRPTRRSGIETVAVRGACDSAAPRSRLFCWAAHDPPGDGPTRPAPRCSGAAIAVGASAARPLAALTHKLDAILCTRSRSLDPRRILFVRSRRVRLASTRRALDAVPGLAARRQALPRRAASLARRPVRGVGAVIGFLPQS